MYADLKAELEGLGYNLLVCSNETDYPNEHRTHIKRFHTQNNIGKAKYTVSYHDGIKEHKDGSDFFDIAIFKNKKAFAAFQKELLKQGYKQTN